MKNVSIGGDVTNSVLVFGNNNNVIKIGDVNGGIVNVIQPSDRPKFSARPAPVILKPRPFPSLLDRENELDLIKKAVAALVPVSIWGQKGIGKTSFVRQLTHLLDAGSFPNGVIHLNTSNLRLEDLLQALFDSLFESEATYKPTTTEIRHALRDIKALIFLDDLGIDQDEVLSLMDAAPNSLFILSGVERSLWGEGEVISLRGLPEAEMLKLFEKELSHPLNEQEKEMASQICNLLQGHPLHILQMASLARETGRPIVSILRDVKNKPISEKSIATISMANLGNPEKKLLALLAAAGGNVLSLEHIKKILPEPDTQESIYKLLSLGLIQAHSPRISLAGALETPISTMWDLSSWHDILLRYFIDWLIQQPAQTLVEESTDAIIHTIQTASKKKQWREVIELGRALENFVVLYKRWQTWYEVLNLILKAAKALNDRKVEAWTLHQLGSRALYLGYTKEAKSFLIQALNLRKVIGDKAGLAITQHNINTLNGVVLNPKNSGCRKYLGWGCGSAVGLAILATIIWVAFRFFFPPFVEVPATIEPIIVTEINTITQTPTKVTPTLTKATRTPSPTFTPTPTDIPPTVYVPPPTEIVYNLIGSWYGSGDCIVVFYKDNGNSIAGYCNTSEVEHNIVGTYSDRDSISITITRLHIFSECETSVNGYITIIDNNHLTISQEGWGGCGVESSSVTTSLTR